MNNYEIELYFIRLFMFNFVFTTEAEQMLNSQKQTIVD